VLSVTDVHPCDSIACGLLSLIPALGRHACIVMTDALFQTLNSPLQSTQSKGDQPVRMVGS